MIHKVTKPSELTKGRILGSYVLFPTYFNDRVFWHLVKSDIFKSENSIHLIFNLYDEIKELDVTELIWSDFDCESDRNLLRNIQVTLNTCQIDTLNLTSLIINLESRLQKLKELSDLLNKF